MLKRIKIGEAKKEVKFHGNVLYEIFECNSCHKKFEKPSSYVQKQLKKRHETCLFCSPKCRQDYFRNALKGIKQPVSEGKPQNQSLFIKALKNILMVNDRKS